MKLHTVLLLCIVLLASCQNLDRMKKPEDLIPKEKMVEVLVELSLLQAAKTSNRSLYEQGALEYAKALWTRYDIDSLHFVESNAYYAQNYAEYEEIYKEVQTRLEVMKVKYDSLKEIDEKIRDSIRMLNPEDSLERVREERFRDSILNLPIDEGTLPPAPASQE